MTFGPPNNRESARAKWKNVFLAGAFQKELSTNLARKNSSNRVVFASFRAWDHRLIIWPKRRNVSLAIMVILLYGSVGLAIVRADPENQTVSMAFALLTAALGVGSLPPKWQLEAYGFAFASRSVASGASCFTDFLKR